MENWDNWLSGYFDLYKTHAFNKSIYKDLKAFHDLALSVRKSNKKMMFAGNGASASIASHGAVDFTKQGQVRSRDFNEANLITCFANDYGYENWIAKATEFYGHEGDVLILISVSGKSPNAINAAEYAKSSNISVVTFTGSASDNPLRSLGDINFWIDSSAYNVVEGTHMIWLTTVVDMLVGQAEYSVT